MPSPRTFSPSPPTSKPATAARSRPAPRNEGLLGYLVADPNDIEASRDILQRWGDEPGIVGVKVHTEWSHRHTGSPRDLGAVRRPRRPRPARQDPQRRSRLGPAPAPHRSRASQAADHHRPRRTRLPEPRGRPDRAPRPTTSTPRCRRASPSSPPSASSCESSRRTRCCSGPTRRCSIPRSSSGRTRTPEIPAADRVGCLLGQRGAPLRDRLRRVGLSCRRGRSAASSTRARDP